MLQIIFIIFASCKFLGYLWGLISGSTYKSAPDALHASAMIVGSTIGSAAMITLSIIAAIYPTSSFAFVLGIVFAALQGIGGLLLLGLGRFARSLSNWIFVTLFIVALVLA